MSIKRLPSYAIGFEDGEPTGEALGEAEVLRRLVARLDAAEVAEAQRMLTQVDVKRPPSYKIGFEDGEETGEARCTRPGEAQIVRRLLARLDATKVADLLGLTPEEVADIVTKGGEGSPDPG